MLEAGAEVLVAGTSSLFDQKAPLEENIVRFRSILNEHEQKKLRKKQESFAA